MVPVVFGVATQVLVLFVAHFHHFNMVLIPDPGSGSATLVMVHDANSDTPTIADLNYGVTFITLFVLDTPYLRKLCVNIRLAVSVPVLFSFIPVDTILGFYLARYIAFFLSSSKLLLPVYNMQ
jgi:hypothetical protein